MDPTVVAPLLHALHFAATKHRDQRRKGAEASPFINHPIEVAELLARVGGITDLITLQAAILHDTLEDTQTTTVEVEAIFGSAVCAVVCAVVQEITHTKESRKSKPKRLEIDHAPHLSVRAKLVKLADEISNVRSIIETPPAEWSLERRREYFNWSERVVAGCRGSNAALEQAYDDLVAEGRKILSA